MIATRVEQTKEYFDFGYPEGRYRKRASQRDKKTQKMKKRFRVMILNNNLTLLKYLRKRLQFYSVRLFYQKEDEETDFWAFVHDKKQDRTYLMSFYIQGTEQTFRCESKFSYNLNPVHDTNGRIKGYEILDDGRKAPGGDMEEENGKEVVDKEDSEVKIEIGNQAKKAGNEERGVIKTMDNPSDGKGARQSEEVDNFDLTKIEAVTSANIDTASKPTQPEAKDTEGYLKSIRLSTRKYGVNRTKQNSIQQIDANFVINNVLLHKLECYKRSNLGYRFFRTGNGKILKKKRNRSYLKKCEKSGTTQLVEDSNVEERNRRRGLKRKYNLSRGSHNRFRFDHVNVGGIMGKEKQFLDKRGSLGAELLKKFEAKEISFRPNILLEIGQTAGLDQPPGHLMIPEVPKKIEIYEKNNEIGKTSNINKNEFFEKSDEIKTNLVSKNNSSRTDMNPINTVIREQGQLLGKREQK